MARVSKDGRWRNPGLMVRDGAMRLLTMRGLMRFDLVDLQLFVAVAETRSITNGAQEFISRWPRGVSRSRGWKKRSAFRC